MDRPRQRTAQELVGYVARIGNEPGGPHDADAVASIRDD